MSEAEPAGDNEPDEESEEVSSGKKKGGLKFGGVKKIKSAPGKAKEKSSEEEKKEESNQVSDKFLGLKYDKPSYQHEEEESKKESEDDDDADFERDEEDGDEDANVEIEKEENKVKVKVNMTPAQQTKKEEKEEIKKLNNFDILDLLFSFISGSEDETEDGEKTQREVLNLDRPTSNSSRATAGTTVAMPGPIEFSNMPSSSILAGSFKKGSQPELLPVSCGYFFNIVRMLLMKQRKTMLRYLLIHSGGRAFDKLVKYIKYHSLSDLLMEMMQLTVGY